MQDAQPSSVAAAQLQSMPARVRMHHLRTLLDWAASTLLKGSAALLSGQDQPGSTAGATHSLMAESKFLKLSMQPCIYCHCWHKGPWLLCACAENSHGSTAEGRQVGMQTVGRLWALLAALLQSPEAAATAAVKPALLAAAAQACQAAGAADLRSGQELAAVQSLGSALLRCLRQLSVRESAHFAPSLEHRLRPCAPQPTFDAAPQPHVTCAHLSDNTSLHAPSVAMAEAALGALAALRRPAAGQLPGELWAAWVDVACLALRMLCAVAAAHPTQRKVYVAIIPRLLALLLRLPAASPTGAQRAAT